MMKASGIYLKTSVTKMSRTFGLRLVTLVLVASFITPLFFLTGTASAATSQELKDCAKYDGSKFVITALQPNPQPINNMNIGPGGPTQDHCIYVGACSSADSKVVRCLPANFSAQVTDSVLAPLVFEICGPSSGGAGGYAAYRTCADGVAKTYQDCKAATRGANAGSDPDNDLALCVASRSAGANPDRILAAIKQGRKNGQATSNAAQCAASGGTLNASGNCSTNSSTATKEPPTCEMNWESAIAWFVCPIVTVLADTVMGIQDIINDMLRTDVVSNPSVKKAWSDFRILGNVLLVIGLLVIVIGESVGGGVMEAYAVKKALPRILIAAILINISYFIALALNDVFNVIGQGIYSLLVAPFGNTPGAAAFKLDIFSFLGVSATAMSGTAVVVALVKMSMLGDVLMSAIMPLFLFVILPIVLILLAVLFVIIMREGIIMLLVIISPIAFALYTLPNTEKYFKKWWEELTKALLIYPIIMVMFALSKDLGVVMSYNGSYGGLRSLVQLILIVAPVALIVFSFKLAGGMIGNLMGFARGLSGKTHQGILGNPNDENSLRNRTKRNFGSSLKRAHAQNYRQLKKGGAFSRRLASASTIFGDPLAAEAALNASSKKRVADVKDNGDDAIVNARASFIDTRAHLANGQKNDMYGKRVTLNGSEVNEADWRAAKRFYPNLSDAQAVADYRSTKVNSDQEAHDFAYRFGQMAQQEGMSLEETRGAFTALAFARQNERGEWKHGEWQSGSGGFQFSPVGAGHLSGAKNYVHEQYHKKGAFDASRAFSSQFTAMGDVKRAHLDTIRAGASSSATKEQRQAAAEAREELRKVIETQDAWGKNSGGFNENGEPIIGLSGASAATQASYRDLTRVGMDNDTDRQIISALESEIARGDTWEHLNNQRHGIGSAPPSGSTPDDLRSKRPSSPYRSGGSSSNPPKDDWRNPNGYM